MDRLFRCLLVPCAVLAMVYATTEKDIYIFDSETTTISSVGFPACHLNNMDVAWRIYFGSPSGDHYAVVETLGLEHTDDCSHDYLAFYNGSTSRSTEIIKMCGTLSSSCRVSFSERYGYVRFVTDCRFSYEGFKLSIMPRSYASECSGSRTSNTNLRSCGSFISDDAKVTSLMAKDSSQTFEVPSYTPPYKRNTDLAWKIDAGSSHSHRVRITVEYWDLERASGCYFDYIMFYDGPSTSDTAYGPYCSYEDTCTFTSSGRFALVTFHSDSSDNFDGFRMKYERYSGHESQVMSCTGGGDSTSRPGSIVLVIGVLIGIILSFEVVL